MSKTPQKSGTACPSGTKAPTTRLITAKELAKHLATTERNVNRQAAEGTIPCVSFGRSRRFDPMEVAEALNLKNPIIL
jgi:excisionase family DNA binding protein